MLCDVLDAGVLPPIEWMPLIVPARPAIAERRISRRTLYGFVSEARHRCLHRNCAPNRRHCPSRRSFFEAERSLLQLEVAGIGRDGLHHVLGITRFGSRSLEFEGEAQG